MVVKVGKNDYKVKAMPGQHWGIYEKMIVPGQKKKLMIL